MSTQPTREPIEPCHPRTCFVPPCKCGRCPDHDPHLHFPQPTAQAGEATIDCRMCDGTGYIDPPVYAAIGKRRTCATCRGTGKVPAPPTPSKLNKESANLTLEAESKISPPTPSAGEAFKTDELGTTISPEAFMSYAPYLPPASPQLPTPEPWHDKLNHIMDGRILASPAEIEAVWNQRFEACLEGWSGTGIIRERWYGKEKK